MGLPEKWTPFSEKIPPPVDSMKENQGKSMHILYRIRFFFSKKDGLTRWLLLKVILLVRIEYIYIKTQKEVCFETVSITERINLINFYHGR